VRYPSAEFIGHIPQLDTQDRERDNSASGYSINDDFIQNPFNIKGLSQKLRELLNEK
jgi:hypothetical protein